MHPEPFDADREKDAATSAEQDVAQPHGGGGQRSVTPPGAFGSPDTDGQQRQYQPQDDQFARTTPETDEHGANTRRKDDPDAQPQGGQTSEHTADQQEERP
jgi:hypothetical protein